MHNLFQYFWFLLQKIVPSSFCFLILTQVARNMAYSFYIQKAVTPISLKKRVASTAGKVLFPFQLNLVSVEQNVSSRLFVFDSSMYS